jgi:hypothetical protein
MHSTLALRPTCLNILDVVDVTSAQLICAHAHNCLVTQVSERSTHIQKKKNERKEKR